MRNAILFLLAAMGAVECEAQASCDSMYARYDAWMAGKVGVVLFDQAPQITAGKERLRTYNAPKDHVGMAFIRVLLDEQGTPSCVRLHVTNELIRPEVSDIISALRFMPAMVQGKATPAITSLAVVFVEGPSPTTTKHRWKLWPHANESK